MAEVLLAENARLRCGFVGIIFEKIPSAEDQVVEVRQWNEFFDERGIVFGAFAQANRA